MNTNTQIPNDPKRAVSPISFKRRLPAQETVNGETGEQRLEILVELPEFKLFRIPNGDYVVDRSIGTETSQEEIYGEYGERRQRLRVTSYEALESLLYAIVPTALLPLLNEILRKQARALRDFNELSNSKAWKPTDFGEFVAGMPDSLAQRGAYLEIGLGLFPDNTPQGRHLRKLLHYLNLHQLACRELLQ